MKALSTKLSKLTAPLAAAGVALTIAVGAAGGSPAYAATHSQSPRATASDTITWVWQSPEIPFFHSIFLPKMVCPTDYPYMLDQQYNGGSGFRIEPGVEIADYQRGLDVVALDALEIPYTKGDQKGNMLVGISGAQDVIMNTATNWGSKSRFKVVLHCTSDPAQGVFRASRNDS